MTNLVNLFPLTIYQSELEIPQCDLILKYADKIKIERVASDDMGISNYQENFEFNILFKQIQNHLTEYCRVIGYKPEMFDFYVMRSWIVDIKENKENVVYSHIHPFSDISLVYYAVDSSSPIVFENENKPNELMMNSYVSGFVDKNNFFCQDASPFFPSKNSLLLFPSKAKHRVDRNLNDLNRRTSFSADILMVLKENEKSHEYVRNPINTWKKL
jgi:hypothetical protein